MISLSLSTELFQAKLGVLLVVVELFGGESRTGAVGRVLAERTVRLLLQASVPSLVPSLGVIQAVQFSPTSVSWETIKSVLFWYRARIWAADKERFQMRTSSMAPPQF